MWMEKWLYLQKMQVDAAKFGISVKHELKQRPSWYFERSNRQQFVRKMLMNKNLLKPPVIKWFRPKLLLEG